MIFLQSSKLFISTSKLTLNIWSLMLVSFAPSPIHHRFYGWDSNHQKWVVHDIAIPTLHGYTDGMFSMFLFFDAGLKDWRLEIPTFWWLAIGPLPRRLPLPSRPRLLRPFETEYELSMNHIWVNRWISEIIPFYGRKIQVSELLELTQISTTCYNRDCFQRAMGSNDQWCQWPEFDGNTSN